MPFVRSRTHSVQRAHGLAGYVAAVRGMGQCFDPEDGAPIDCGNGTSMPPVDNTLPITGVTLPGSSTAGLPGGAVIPNPPTPGNTTTPAQPSSVASILAALASGA